MMRDDDVKVRFVDGIEDLLALIFTYPKVALIVVIAGSPARV
jgi:uncharacterized protein (UPF0218 family)